MSRKPAFTLIELLVVVSIIALLIAILLPSLHGARGQARAAVCLSNMRQLAHGWHLYADDNRDYSLPGRHAKASGGVTNPANWFEIGNGLKYRPRWIATMGRYVGLFAFNQPSEDERQDYDGQAYRCPTAATWTDERNHAFGYNYQFLGNARLSNGQFVNYPVRRSHITSFAATVLSAECMGTAAGKPASERLDYSNNGTQFAEIGNHAWTLDPPRLTATSDRGSGDPGTPRSAVDPRHAGKANTVFADGHGLPVTPAALGYRQLPNGAFVDLETVENPPDNRLFSGRGQDDDPPSLP